MKKIICYAIVLFLIPVFGNCSELSISIFVDDESPARIKCFIEKIDPNLPPQIPQEVNINNFTIDDNSKYDIKIAVDSKKTIEDIIKNLRVIAGN